MTANSAERLAAALGRITEAFGWNAKELMARQQTEFTIFILTGAICGSTFDG